MKPKVIEDLEPTAGEWTPQTVFDLLGSDYGNDGWQRERNVAAAHNAALDAAEHKWNLARLTDIKEVTDKAAQQLAAEREKAQETARAWFNREIDKERQQLREQLAAHIKAANEAAVAYAEYCKDEPRP